MRKRKIYLLTLFVAALVAAIVIHSMIVATNPIRFRSKEEPFLSLKQPFTKVSAGYIMDGGSVILVVVDAEGREEAIQAQWDYSTQSRSEVYRNGMGRLKPTDRLKDAEAALADMEAILWRHHDQLDEGSRFAYRALAVDSGVIGGVSRLVDKIW